jgi:ribosomal protein L24E
LVLLAAATTISWVAPIAQAQVSSAALTDPPANVPRTAAMALACSNGPQDCQQAVVQAIDQARAGEGIGPLELPPYYDSITTAAQLLVLANLERTDRGLPGFAGLSSKLNGLSLSAASMDTDPDGPSGTTWGSNWAGGEASALLADYDWVYDDGPGSPNMDCTSALSSGCWDHRRNVLGDYGPHPAMGAAMTAVKGVTSMTELFTSGPPGQLDYTLPRTGAPQLVVPSTLEIGTTPGVANSAMLTVKDGGGSFEASASVSGVGGLWSVTPSCNVSAGSACHLFVTFAPRQQGPAAATVTVDLPDRSDQVGVNGYAGRGYWEATQKGAVFAYAGGGFRGSAVGLRLAKPIVGMSATPDGGGYWEVAADGGVFSYGDARFYGSAAKYRLKGSIVGMAATLDGKGYWLVERNGNVFSFGDAKFYGPAAGMRLAGPVVGIVPTRNGRGYWLGTVNGNVFSFGDAKFYGPSVQLHLGQPVVGMARTAVGNGYWLVSADGRVFSFGDAKSYTPSPGTTWGPTIGIAASVDGPGYYLLQADGGVLSFGGAPAAGDTQGALMTSPVVAMATT